MTKDDNFEVAVNSAAKSKGCIFFIKNGEGRDFETDTMAGEDLFGWLIPSDSENEFRKEFDTGDVSDKWIDYMCFAIWHYNNGNISITFEQY